MRRVYPKPKKRTQGVSGRNSDNTLIKRYLGWEPDTPVRTGLKKTYDWIYGEMTKNPRCS